MLHILNTRPPRPVILGFLSFVVRTGASLCLLILYYAVASQSEGVVRTHTVAFRCLLTLYAFYRQNKCRLNLAV